MKKKAFIVSFGWDTKILTADRTAGSAAVCKAVLNSKLKDQEPFNIQATGCSVLKKVVLGYEFIQQFEHGFTCQNHLQLSYFIV